MSDPHHAYGAQQSAHTRRLTDPTFDPTGYEPWPPESTPPPAAATAAGGGGGGQFTAETSTPPPIDIPKFAGGTIAVTAVGAASSALVAAITNAFAAGLGVSDFRCKRRF